MNVVQLQTELRASRDAASGGGPGRGHRLHPEAAKARVLELAAVGKRPKEIVAQLGYTKGYIAGVLFRARGGARHPRGPQKGKLNRPPAFAPPLLGNWRPEWQAMDAVDKERMAGAYLYEERDGTWVAIPDITWPGLGRRPVRHRQGLLSQVRAISPADARQLAHHAWGFY